MIHKLLLLAIATAFIATGNATAQKKFPQNQWANPQQQPITTRWK